MSKKSKLELTLKFLLDKTGLSNAGELLEAFKTRAKQALTGLAIGAVAGLTAAFWQLTKSIKEFAQQELGEFDVKSALVAMGQYTDDYQKKLINLANQYQKTTNIADDSWLKTFGQLTRFGMNADNVDRVAAAVKNLAALMDGNIEGAAMAMQRALEGEFSMFSRYGIKLELTGNAKQDLETLFDNLEKKGAGLLEARAETLSGKWQALKNSVSDFQEEVGRVLTEALGLKGGLEEVAEWFDALQESAKNGALHNILSSAAEQVREWAKQIADIVEQIKSVEDLKIVAGVIGDWLAEKLYNAGVRIAAFLLEKAPFIGYAIGKAAYETITNVFKDAATHEQLTAAKTQAANETTSISAYLIRLEELLRESKVQNRTERLTQEGKYLAAQVEISAASQQSLADRINAALQAAREATPDKQLYTVQIPDGTFIGDEKGLREFIENLRQTDEALANMVQQAADSQTKTQEATKATTESATKAAAAAVDSNGKVTEALDRSKDASLSAAQAAQRNIQVTEQALALVGSLAGGLARLEQDVGYLRGQVNSMRA
jgi:hypothetical protein